MENYKKEMVEKKVLVSITCDICKKTHDDDIELQEFVSIRETGGYGSIFGDMSAIGVDICQHCLKEKLGKYLIIKQA